MPREPHLRFRKTRAERLPDRAFRLAGLASILVAVAALGGLSHLLGAGMRHPATIAEFLAGAVGFAAASAGAALLALGAHLLDPVAIPGRRRGMILAQEPECTATPGLSAVSGPLPSGDSRRPVR